MRLSGSMRAQIGTLILATSGVQLANGFFNTLISLRVAIEDFEPTLAGLVLSSYFAGFTLAALRCGRIIERIGHIRAYAAFAGLVVAATATMPLLIGALPWLVLRTVVGFGCAGLFITTESWLNAKAEPAERGRVFSVYMVGTFVALAVGQLLIGGAKIESAEPFNAIVALFAVALVMVTTTRAEPPRLPAAANLPYGQLVRAAPVAVGGGALSGLISSSFYALVPAWMQDEGIARETIATSMLVAVLGGLAFQVPIGRLSDRFDRRIVLAALCVGFAGAAIALVLLPHSLPVPAGRSAARRLYVYPLPGLRRPRTRPHAGRPGRGGKRPAHSGQWARFGDWPAHRHEPHGTLQHRRCVILYDRRRPPPGLPGRGPELDHGVAGAPETAVRDPGATGDAARARSTRLLRRAPVAGPCRGRFREGLISAAPLPAFGIVLQLGRGQPSSHARRLADETASAWAPAQVRRLRSSSPGRGRGEQGALSRKSGLHQTCMGAFLSSR